MSHEPNVSGAEEAAFRYTEESRSKKLARKSKESPLVVIGLAGCTLACIYGAYAFKHRGKLSVSNYLMQLRVAAQGTVIGCMTLGVVYSLYSRFSKKSDDSSGT